jgi:hypothetical protein
MELRDKWIKEGSSARFKDDRSAATGERVHHLALRSSAGYIGQRALATPHPCV